MDRATIENYLINLDDVTKEELPDESVVLFRAADTLIAVLELSDPLRISLRCEPQLSSVLREKYETVMPGRKLNHKYWNTIVLTGQIKWPEIQGFIQLSYNLARNHL